MLGSLPVLTDERLDRTRVSLLYYPMVRVMVRKVVLSLPAIRSLEMRRVVLPSSFTRFTVWQEVLDHGPRAASFCQFCTLLIMPAKVLSPAVPRINPGWRICPNVFPD